MPPGAYRDTHSHTSQTQTRLFDIVIDCLGAELEVGVSLSEIVFVPHQRKLELPTGGARTHDACLLR